MNSSFRSLIKRNASQVARAYATTPASTPIKRPIATKTTGQPEAIEKHPSTSASDLKTSPVASPNVTPPKVTPPPANTRISEAPWSGIPLPDAPPLNGVTNWDSSYHGLSQTPFSKEASEILLAPIDLNDIEIKPGKSSLFFSGDKGLFEVVMGN
jgi:hypothetical protein